VVSVAPGACELAQQVVPHGRRYKLPRPAGSDPIGSSVRLSQEVRGEHAVLELSHVGTDWSTTTPRIHIELCVTLPPAKRRHDRQQGAWIESHATYEVFS
jgi:hypothetical protein